MFSEKDKQQIRQRGSELHTVLTQIENFKKGFPFLPVREAASVGNGIIQLNPENLAKRIELYDEKVAGGIKPLKFVPASGAASRMFKALFEGLEALATASEEEVISKNKDIKHYLEGLDKFAFAKDLTAAIEADGAE